MIHRFIRKVLDRGYRYIIEIPQLNIIFHKMMIRRRIKNKNIWLFGIPKSRNLGDQAQVICSEKWFCENYPGYAIHKFESGELLGHNGKLLDFIASVVCKNDLIFFQSGYNLTDLYPFQEEMHRAVAKKLTQNPIVFLPQTISFKGVLADNSFARDSNECYKKHGDVFLLCRDEKSFAIAKEVLPDVKTYPFPDVVTTLIGRIETKFTDRSGIAICVRHDVESAMSKEDLLKLSSLEKQYCNVDWMDTTVDYPSHFIIRTNRKKYVFDMINIFICKEVVITDRYHGLIFAVAAQTPVIILKTIDHKLTEGLKWFPNEFRKYIRVVESVDQVPQMIEELRRMPNMKTDDYFCRTYYNNLKSIIDENRLNALEVTNYER